MTNGIDAILQREQQAAEFIRDRLETSFFWRHRHLFWLIAVSIAALGAAAALLHVWADARWGEDEPRIIFHGSFFFGAFVRLVFICTYPILMFLLLAQFASNMGSWRSCLFAWFMLTILIMIPLTIWREPIAVQLANDAVRPYPFNNPWEYGFVGWSEWKARWNIGLIHAIELAYVAIMAAVAIAFVPYARLVPGMGLLWFYAILAATIQYIVTIVYPLITGLVVLDYDIFLGGTFVDSLSLQAMAIIFASDPHSAVNFPVTFLFLLATYVCFLHTERRSASTNSRS